MKREREDIVACDERGQEGAHEVAIKKRGALNNTEALACVRKP